MRFYRNAGRSLAIGREGGVGRPWANGFAQGVSITTALALFLKRFHIRIFANFYAKCLGLMDQIQRISDMRVVNHHAIIGFTG